MKKRKKEMTFAERKKVRNLNANGLTDASHRNERKKYYYTQLFCRNQSMSCLPEISIHDGSKDDVRSTGDSKRMNEWTLRLLFYSQRLALSTVWASERVVLRERVKQQTYLINRRWCTSVLLVMIRTWSDACVLLLLWVVEYACAYLLHSSSVAV